MKDEYIKAAVIELDGENYQEHKPYDPFMIGQMWGFSLENLERIQDDYFALNSTKELIKANIISPQNKVLVPGARQGSFVFALKNQGINVQGTDDNEETVMYVKEKTGTDSLQYAPQTKLPYPDSSFDTLLYHSSLFMNEHSAINEMELQEAKRVLKPEGVVIVEGANGMYWEPIRKSAEDLHEYSSAEEGIWALKKDPALAKWRRRENIIWLEFFFITVNSENLRVNHVYHFVPRQDSIEIAKYYHEVVNYEPIDYRITLLNAAGFVNTKGESIQISDAYDGYSMKEVFNEKTSPGSVLIVKKKS